MNIPTHRGYVRVGLDVLSQALGFPADMGIRGIAVTADDLFADTVTLAVAGPACPEVPEGVAAPNLLLRLMRHRNGRVSVASLETPGLSSAATPVAQVSEAPVVWFVGQLRFEGDEDEPSSWEMQGIFTSRDKAIAACPTEHYFVCAVEMDSPLPDETMTVDETTRSSFFPLIDDPARVDSLPVLGQGAL